ncbi:hypothetical protein FQA47_016841 [Oryzias melastigma]|uniref:Uncharacterized protein n=1 Tax=Oryzias melastigma TaxID=30732 RepID=A0A834CB94_ORYME|nr:hypothetical protein FQA47_016841 [Oryzias melastigma]
MLAREHGKPGSSHSSFSRGWLRMESAGWEITVTIRCCLGSVQARRESKTAITSDQVLSSYNWLHKMLNVDEVQQMYEQLCRRE